MEDYQIVELYWQRSEDAIGETSRKYGGMLNRLSYSLLSSREDAEECVNDTYLRAWNQMPEDRPVYLGAYLAKIIRCLSVSRFRSEHRQKRGGMDRVTEELTDCIPDSADPRREYENGLLADAINRFLAELDEEKRRIFLRRYFYSEEISVIARDMGLGVSKVKTTLFRLRGSLKELLEQEGLM